MILFVKKLLSLISDFAILYILYHIICFLDRLHRLGIGERLSFIIYSCILRLKTYFYLPTTVRKWIKNIKPCCFSLDWQYKLQHAIQNNHVDCLKKAYENGCKWKSEICNMLMLLNHKECLQYAHSNGCDWDFCTCDEVDGNFNTCVENGLRLIKDNTHDFTDTYVCDTLAVGKDKKCLLFAHYNGYDWDHCSCDEGGNTFGAAAKGGNDVSKCVNDGLYKIHVLPTLDA